MEHIPSELQKGTEIYKDQLELNQCKLTTYQTEFNSAIDQLVDIAKQYQISKLEIENSMDSREFNKHKQKLQILKRDIIIQCGIIDSISSKLNLVENSNASILYALNTYQENFGKFEV